MRQNRAHAVMGDRRAGTIMRDRIAADRLLIVAGVDLIWMAAIFGRLGYLQLFRHSEYMTRAQRQQKRVIEITPKRGAIYDRNMHPLAMSLQVDSLSQTQAGRATTKPKPPHCSRAGWTFPRTCLKQNL